jgi:hypothetical protein
MVQNASFRSVFLALTLGLLAVAAPAARLVAAQIGTGSDQSNLTQPAQPAGTR